MSEKQVEIIVRKNGSLIRLEHFFGDQNIIVNGSDPFVNVPPEWLGQDLHRMVAMLAGAATLYFLPTMTVKINKKPFKGLTHLLELREDVDIVVGPFSFNIRLTQMQKPIMTPPSKEGDWRFGQILGGVAIVQLMTLVLSIVDVAA